MFKPTAIAAVMTLAACACMQTATAGEQVLPFRLVVTFIDPKTVEAPNVDGQVILMTRAFGVAYFKDGRVASKNFVFSSDYNKGSGPFFGYSTYQFEDGSSITARFAGTQRAGQMTHGEYTVLSGTGAYAGAKGTGTFDGVPHKFTSANLLEGKFTITVP